ncbi:MAG TPA: hypothetical protein VLY20_01215 [Nitrospiria bacterium]|nr:hypothetical protein [Nitrospiria bacterium]
MGLPKDRTRASKDPFVKRKPTSSDDRIDFSGVRTYPLKDRKSKVSIREFGRPYGGGDRITRFIDSLPDILAAKDLKAVIEAVARAHRKKRPIVVGMGAHLTKVGLNPILIDLMERGAISAVAVNGAVIIHDFELALAGKTSEDVEEQLGSGAFGMAEETGRILNEAIVKGVPQGLGIGAAVGQWLNRSDAPNKKHSLLATADRLGIPVTVHVAIGTDIIHMHPSVSGAALGEGSLLDFKRLCSVVARLEGGVYLNIGSAVILPEVFLKALTLVRNLGHTVDRFTTVNLDFIQQYRPLTNVVRRPTQKGGKGYSLTGHHEIMVPLLAAGIIERIRRSS